MWQLRRPLGRRHRRPAPRVAEEDPDRPKSLASPSWIRDKYLSEIKGINIAAPSNRWPLLYAADSDLGIVGVIDTREDKVDEVIRVGNDRGDLHEPRRQIRHHPNNGDETI